ncbi:hypothetical protein AB431_11525 [Mycobacterium sp. EPa45]|nr:hypothetical protein AB431_11525 [Mycobacterium sp. EPa45]
MTLNDPHEALADRSDFIGYLVGLAGLADMVRSLAAEGDRHARPARDCDDFVYALLGLASTGAAIQRMANSPSTSHKPTLEVAATARFLR